MRPTWGIGTIVAVLLPAAVYSFGVIGFEGAVSFFLLLEGLWTLSCGLLLVEKKDRWYYGGWGVVLAFLSAFAFLPVGYTIGLVLIAIIALILLYVYMGGVKRALTVPTPPAAPAAGARQQLVRSVVRSRQAGPRPLLSSI